MSFKILVVSLLAVLVCVSCAGVSQQTPFKTLVTEADLRVGESVTLGGYLYEGKKVDDKVYIVVTQAPLGLTGRPKSEDKSEGRFLVSYDGRLDSYSYSAKRPVVVTGQIAGTAREEVENCPSPCLKIESSDFKILREYPRSYGGSYSVGAQIMGGPH